MTSSAGIRASAVAALTGTTAAGQNVYFARTWPTQPDSYPILLIPPLEEVGESWGPNGAPSFNVTTTLKVFARVQEPAELAEGGALAVALELEQLRDEIKAAIINNPTLMGQDGPVQQFSRFSCRPHVTADGEQPLGEMVVEIDMVFVQSAADFFQVQSVPLEGVDLSVQMPPGTVQPGFSITFPLP